MLQYAVIDDKQLLVEVYLAFFVDGIQIAHVLSACATDAFLYYGLASADSACPVYLVVAGVEILHDEHHKTLVPLVPLLQSE